MLSCVPKSQAACGSWGLRWGSGWPAGAVSTFQAPQTHAGSGWVIPHPPGGTCLILPAQPPSIPQGHPVFAGALAEQGPCARLSSVPGTRALLWTKQLLRGAPVCAPGAPLGTARVTPATGNNPGDSASFSFVKWGDEARRSEVASPGDGGGEKQTEEPAGEAGEALGLGRGAAGRCGCRGGVEALAGARWGQEVLRRAAELSGQRSRLS